MIKDSLIEKMAEQAGTSKTQAEGCLSAFMQIVGETLAAGEKVTLVGFGSFSAVQREARVGRNPGTGERVDIPSKTVPKFSPGSKLKDTVNGQ